MPATRLIRGISRGHLLAMHVNGMVGAGVLGLPATAFGMSGAYSLVAWVVAATLVAGIALCLAEVSSRYDKSGGPYLIALDAFGPTVGFVTGWLIWVSRVLAFATVCGLLVEYVGLFADGAARGAGRVAFVSSVVAALTCLLLSGIRQTAWVSTLLTVVKVALLVVFAIGGLLLAQAPVVIVGTAPSFASFTATISVLLFAFFGFENGPIATGETVDPRRNLPFAILASVAIVSVLYVVVQYACIVTLPGLAESRRPLADAATLMLGSVGGRIVAGGAIVVMLGTLLPQMIGTTRTLMAMGEQGQLPSQFSVLHEKRRVPVLATLLCAVAALAATLLSSFTTAITITVATRVFTYVILCLALPVLRTRRAGAPFHLRAGIVIALMSAVLSLSLITTAALRDVVATAIVAVSGWIVWRVVRERWQMVEDRLERYPS
ncbi:MAG TPA: APC family permease [Vicinamibacterales bacterium]|nr:APC family permease [Vicinamibacterales bacterium]